MPKLASIAVPSYRLHRKSGQAIVTRSGKDYLLGKHDSPASHAEYTRQGLKISNESLQPILPFSVKAKSSCDAGWGFMLQAGFECVDELLEKRACMERKALRRANGMTPGQFRGEAGNAFGRLSVMPD